MQAVPNQYNGLTYFTKTDVQQAMCLVYNKNKRIDRKHQLAIKHNKHFVIVDYKLHYRNKRKFDEYLLSIFFTPRKLSKNSSQDGETLAYNDEGNAALKPIGIWEERPSTIAAPDRSDAGSESLNGEHRKMKA